MCVRIFVVKMWLVVTPVIETAIIASVLYLGLGLGRGRRIPSSLDLLWSTFELNAACISVIVGELVVEIGLVIVFEMVVEAIVVLMVVDSRVIFLAEVLVEVPDWAPADVV